MTKIDVNIHATGGVELGVVWNKTVAETCRIGLLHALKIDSRIVTNPGYGFSLIANGKLTKLQVATANAYICGCVFGASN
jgi:hypothetical protein